MSKAEKRYNVSRSPSPCLSANGMSMAPMANFSQPENDRSISQCMPDWKPPQLQASPENTDAVTTTAESADHLSDGLSEHTLARTWAIWEKTVQTNDDASSHSQAESDAESHAEPTGYQDYSACCSQIKTFDTIETFMPLFNGIPSPSRILDQNHIVRHEKIHESDSESEEEGKGSKSLGRQSTGSILGSVPLKPDQSHLVKKHLDSYMFFEAGVSPTWEDPAHKNGGGLFQFTFKTDFPGVALDEIWERLLFAILGNSLPNCEAITGVRMQDRIPLDFDMSRHIVGVRLEVWHREMSFAQAAAMREHCINCMKQPLICGGSVVAKRTVMKGAYSTKTPMHYSRLGFSTGAKLSRMHKKRGSV